MGHVIYVIMTHWYENRYVTHPFDQVLFKKNVKGALLSKHELFNIHKNISIGSMRNCPDVQRDLFEIVDLRFLKLS